MQSILEEFACGNISPEPRFFRQGSHHGHTMQKLSAIEEKLLATLNNEEKETLQIYNDAQAEINLVSGIDRFIYGYRLGVLMTMEVFQGKDDLITGGTVRG